MSRPLARPGHRAERRTPRYFSPKYAFIGFQ